MFFFKWYVPVVLTVFVCLVSSEDGVYFNQDTVYVCFHSSNDRLIADERNCKLISDEEQSQSALFLEEMVPSLIYFGTDSGDEHVFNPFECYGFRSYLRRNNMKSPHCFINEISQPKCELFCDFYNYGNNEQLQYSMWNHNVERKTSNEILSEISKLISKTNYLTKSLLSFLKSEQYSKELFYDFSEVRRKLNELSLSTIPSVLQYTENLLASSQILTKPHLLNFPLATRTVHVNPSSTESISAQFFRKGQIKNARKSISKGTTDDEKAQGGNSILKSVLQNVYSARQESRDSKSKHSEKIKQRLSLITAEQDNLIHKMTSLLKELEKLKVDVSNSPNESNRSRMAVVRKQLEEMDERKSELYYKKLMLSQNADSY